MAETTIQPNNKLSAPSRKVTNMSKVAIEAGPKDVAGGVKARATQMLKRGQISDKEHAKIMGKANTVIGKTAAPPKVKADPDANAEGAEKDDPPAVKPRGSDQADVKVKPGTAAWET